MVRNYVIKLSIILLFIGFLTGVAGQIELLKPGIQFIDYPVWADLVVLHAWFMPLSCLLICVFTISLIGRKAAAAQWAIWLGFSFFPLLSGILLAIILSNADVSDSYLQQTAYLTALRHAFGTVVLMVALGGLSAWTGVQLKSLRISVYIIFAVLISGSGIAMTLLQSSLGLNGLPKGYVDYPQEFARLQLHSGIAAIALFGFASIYLLILWRSSSKDGVEIENVFQ